MSAKVTSDLSGHTVDYRIEGTFDEVTAAVADVHRLYPTPGYGTWFNWPPGGPNQKFNVRAISAMACGKPADIVQPPAIEEVMHKFLTLTGIDAKTDPKWIRHAIQGLIRTTGYSAVEFGILRSPKVDQSPRYPGRDAITKLLSGGYPGDFAFHLCGRYARMVHSLEWAELCDIIDFSKVGRVQVNSTECDEKAMMTLLRFSVHIDRPVIMQWRGDGFPAVPGLHLLQDRSGGQGIAEHTWISPDDLCKKSDRTKIGYAGGLALRMSPQR